MVIMQQTSILEVPVLNHKAAIPAWVNCQFNQSPRKKAAILPFTMTLTFH
jgi:hypothetical protein